MMCTWIPGCLRGGRRCRRHARVLAPVAGAAAVRRGRPAALRAQRLTFRAAGAGASADESTRNSPRARVWGQPHRTRDQRVPARDQRAPGSGRHRACRLVAAAAGLAPPRQAWRGRWCSLRSQPLAVPGSLARARAPPERCLTPTRRGRSLATPTTARTWSHASRGAEGRSAPPCSALRVAHFTMRRRWRTRSA